MTARLMIGRIESVASSIKRRPQLQQIGLGELMRLNFKRAQFKQVAIKKCPSEGGLVDAELR